MTTFNTGNAIGSTDARDLYDNAQNLDHMANSQSATYPDRFGVQRRTLAALEAEFPNAAANAAAAQAAADTSIAAADTAIQAENATQAALMGAEAARDDAALIADATMFATKVNMDASLAFAAPKFAVVYADTTETNNGIYYKIGASGAGSWALWQGDRFSTLETAASDTKRGVLAAQAAAVGPINNAINGLFGSNAITKHTLFSGATGASGLSTVVNESMYLKFGEPASIQVDVTNSINYAQLFLRISCEDLKNIGVVPNDATPPTVSYRVGRMTGYGQNNNFSGTMYCLCLLRYSNSQSTHFVTEDVQFSNISNTPERFGDATYPISGMTAKNVTSGNVQMVIREGLPILDTYKGKKFVEMILITWSLPTTAGARQVWLSCMNAVVAGSTISETAPYLNSGDSITNGVSTVPAFRFAGIAQPDTNPGSPNCPVSFLASEKGTYTNFLDINDQPIQISMGQTLSELYWTGRYWKKRAYRMPVDVANNLLNGVWNVSSITKHVAYDATGGSLAPVASSVIKAAYMEPNAVQVNISTAPAGQEYKRAPVYVITKSDLAKLNVIPDNTSPPKISIRVGKQKNAGVNNNGSAQIQLQIAVRYGTDATSMYLTPNDVNFYGTTLTPTRFGDATYPNTGHTARRVDDGITECIIHEGISIPASYKGLPFLQVMLMPSSYPQDSTLPSSWISCRNAVVPGSVISDSESYLEPVSSGDTSSSSSNGSTESASFVGTITTKTTDEFLICGDSISSGLFSLKDKNWTSLLSNMTEFNVVNNATPGVTAYEHLLQILAGSAYGTSWSRLNPRYVLVMLNTNDWSYYQQNSDWYRQHMRDLVMALRSKGAEVILGTTHNFTDGVYTIQALANELDVRYWDLSWQTKINGYPTINAPQWNGVHPGTRTTAVMFMELYYRIKELGSPRRALKIFRLRSSVSVADTYSLWYSGPIERAKKWKELTTYHLGLKAGYEKYYDKLTDAVASGTAFDTYSSEYDSLKLGTSVSMGLNALVEATLPTTSKNLSSVKVRLLGTIPAGSKAIFPDFTTTARVSRYPQYKGFLVPSGAAASPGDVYSVSGGPLNGTNITVLHKTGSVLATDISGEAPFGSTTPSTLTKLSGTGDATIAANRTVQAFAAGYYTQFGRMVDFLEKPLTDVEASGYTVVALTEAEVASAMVNGKLPFFLTGTSAISISDIQIEYTLKTVELSHPRLTGQDWRVKSGQSLLAATTFEPSKFTAGMWEKVGTINEAYTPEDGIKPPQIANIIRVNDANYVTQMVTYNSASWSGLNAQVQVLCRYFPPLFDPLQAWPADSLIKADSYDFADLEFVIERGAFDPVRFREIVPNYWVVLRFPITVLDTIKFRVASGDSKYLEIARVDVVTVQSGR